MNANEITRSGIAVCKISRNKKTIRIIRSAFMGAIFGLLLSSACVFLYACLCVAGLGIPQTFNIVESFMIAMQIFVPIGVVVAIHEGWAS